MPGPNSFRPGSLRAVDSQTPIDVVAQTIDNLTTDLGYGFSYFSAEPIAEDDLREYLRDPIGALPPSVCEAVAPVRIVLAPYLTKTAAVPALVFQAPAAASRLRSAYLLDGGATLFFALREESASEYHQVFFNTLAHLLSRRVSKDAQSRYAALLTVEIEHSVNGEVDEPSWERKEHLPRRASDEKPNVRSKAFREYAAQSFADTMTLYMHGICCDIDVETGPRQVPSRWLRKRLELLYQLFPPPNGRAVLPEHLSKR